MKILTFILVVLFSFKSCLKDEVKLHVILDDASGLEKGAKVTCKGLDVGKISDLKIVSNKIIATVNLKGDFQATKGTVAQVDIDNIFGRKSLVLIPSQKTDLLTNGDTIYAISGNKLSILENILKKGDLDSLINGIKLDSMDINIDSIDVDGLLKKAEKIMDLNKLFK